MFGYSCTGKSAVTEILKEKTVGMYILDSDRQKRQISGYQRTVYGSYMKEVLVGFFEVLCKAGSPILLLIPPFKDESEYEQYELIAKKHGYTFGSFELTASREVLLKRYRDRLDSLDKKGIKNSIRTEEEFLNSLEIPYFAPAGSVTIDTSLGDVESIVDQILTRL